MKTDSFKITIHMVMSLDGFIAKKDNSVEWFETTDQYANGITAQSPEDFFKTIDCFVMGSHTYEHAHALSEKYGWAYGDVPTIVLSSRKLHVDRNNIEIYSGDLNKLVNERLRHEYKNVWVVGGAMLVKDFIRLNLADEIRMSVLPILIGNGLLFFDQIRVEKELHLKDVTAYQNGMVELWYEIKK